MHYEDVGAEPELMAQEIFKFLGLNYHKNVETFIHDHTSLNITNTKNKRRKKVRLKRAELVYFSNIFFLK